MTLPIVTNTTCDIYRHANAPPAAPDVAGVKIVFRPEWESGQEHGDRKGPAGLTWTHSLLCPDTTDIRDHYTGKDAVGASPDFVWIPDRNGTKYTVIFVELLHRSFQAVHKRVFLDRFTAPWPTDNV
jgi:hypothetical protein